MKLREVFKEGVFYPPASDALIQRAEARLGVKIPESIASLLRDSNGFREGVGNAKYLLSLANEDTIGSIESVNEYYWQLDSGVDLSKYLFFGFSSADEVWGINMNNESEFIAYHHSMGAEFEFAGSNVMQIYNADLALYNEL